MVTSSIRLLFVVLAGFLCLSTATLAQAPKVGNDYYEDEVDLGFKIKYPKGWDFVPSSPMEQYLIGKYAPPHSQYIEIKGGAVLFQNVWLVKLDRRPESKGGKKDIHEWIKDRLDEGRNWKPDPKKKYPKPLKGVKIPGVKVPAEYYVFQGVTSNNRSGAEPQPINLYVAVYTFHEDEKGEPDLQVALLGVGPNDKKKWRSYESAFSKMAKSFKKLEVEQPEDSGASDGPMSLRDRKRAELEKRVATTPGWELYETDNYFIISSNDDKAFMKELMKRLEAIRAVYEKTYPYEKVREIRNLAAQRKAEEGESDEEPEEGDAEEGDEDEVAEEDMRTVSTVDPREASRCSVVRVCKDDKEYHQYGGPGGSAGYWYWVEEELVIYDDKAVGGRENTWIVLNHEAFHQYIFYLYGNISPHYWYNEGTGDFFSGYQLEHGRFKLKENSWRQRTIQQMIRDDNYAPLEEFVRYGRAEYYGSDNPHGLGGGECYAQGWSFIWFLRTGEKKAKGWQEPWGDILDTYFDTLAVTGDLEEAVDTAFADVDYEALEESWKNFIL